MYKSTSTTEAAEKHVNSNSLKCMILLLLYTTELNKYSVAQRRVQHEQDEVGWFFPLTVRHAIFPNHAKALILSRTKKGRRQETQLLVQSTGAMS